MASKFGAIKAARQQSTAPSLIGRPKGKRSDPNFEQTTVLLRKATKKMANRTLEDTGEERDLSELIESLLQGWISERA